MRLAILTICTNRQLPQAQVMLGSAARFLPGADRFVILADRPHPAIAPPAGCTLVPAQALGIDDFTGFAFRYDMAEFRAALKPFAFLHLAALGYTHALHLGPGIELFGPIPAITAALAAGAPFVLTPQILAPSEGHAPDDVAIMREGVFNLGVLGVGFTPQACSLLGWWARWLRRHCVDDRPIGLYLDQKFIDLLPGFAPGTRILHDPGLNVGAWNMHQRDLQPGAPGGPQVDGAPLGIFDFAGFGDDAPSFLQPFLAAHADRVRAAGGDAAPPYAYARFASGVPIPAIARRLFRDDHPAWAGDPFATFEAWAHLPARDAVLSIGSAIPSLVMQWRHARDPALAGLSLADPAGAAQVTRAWLEQGSLDGLAAVDPRFLQPQAIACGLRPVALHARIPPPGDRPDATVIAPADDSPAGRIGRALLSSLDRVTTRLEHRPSTADPAGGRLIALCQPTPGALPAGAYRVFVPCAECPGIPDLDGIDEVWAPTRFLQAAFVLAADIPVIHMPVAWHFPHPNPVAPDPGARAPYILAEADALPGCDELLAAVQAYRAAFGPWSSTAWSSTPGCRPALVIHAGGRHAWTPALHQAIGQAGAHIVTTPDPATLAAGAACVLALHRGEALGLTVLRAMAWGVPVVAADHGGCTDLLTPATGHPVEVRYDAAGRPGGADVAQAAWLLRDVFARPDAARHRAAAACHRLDTAHAPAAIAAQQMARLRLLGLEPGPPQAYRPHP